MVREVPKELLEQFLKRVPLGRVGQPEEIAKAVLFLASEDSDYVTGGVFMVDGGQVIG
jgi:NAD(P)-dependent dehydrogenase (short-subunit alcohol dehydrogenase family)